MRVQLEDTEKNTRNFRNFIVQDVLVSMIPAKQGVEHLIGELSKNFDAIYIIFATVQDGPV